MSAKQKSEDIVSPCPSGKGANCSIAAEMRDLLRNQTGKLDELVLAIKGDPTIGVEGLVKGQHDHGKRLTALEGEWKKISAVVIGITSTIGVVWAAITHWPKK